MPARHPANKKKERSVFGNIALFTATLLIICVALVAIAGVYFLVIAPPKQPDRLNTSELSDELVFPHRTAPISFWSAPATIKLRRACLP